MKLRYQYQVQYQEVDADRRLRLYTLENYLLNVGGRAADDGGYGIRDLLPYGLTWVIVRLSLEMLYIPTHDEQIEIETWIESYTHLLSVRNYRIYLLSDHGESQLIGQARSTWAVLDIQKREIVNGMDYPMFANSIHGEPLTMTRAPRMRSIAQPDGRTDHTVVYSDIDYNGHVNSCKYLEWMLNAFQPKCLHFGIRLDINYIREIHIPNILTTLFQTTPQGVQYQQIDNEGVSCCIANISNLDHHVLT